VTLNPNTTWNWLGERSAPFQERSRAYRRGRERGGLRPEARLRTSPRPVASGRQIERTHRIRVTFSVELDVDHLEPGTRYRAFLPFPIATETQSGVRLVDTAPAELAGSLAAEFGFVYGAEQRVADRATDVLRYRAELTAAELHVTIDEARRRPAPPVPTFEALRTHALSKTGDPVQRAFWVYDWMCNTGRVRRVSRPCSCPKCCAEQFDAAHEGDCILLAHAFVHYCAQLGVQAQAVRGALFEAPVGFDDRHYRARRLGQPVTCHTWAEFFDPTLGAIPVEFLGLAVGSADPSAYWDPELARADRVDRSFLREVYFGHIDNQRIAYSRSCLGVPCVLVHDMCMRRGRRWVPLDRHRMRFQHEVEVLSDGE
jgi:transglutaminase-like putative cysteine protease